MIGGRKFTAYLIAMGMVLLLGLLGKLTIATATVIGTCFSAFMGAHAVQDWPTGGE